MSEEYNPHEIEARWRAHWDATRRDQFDLDGVSRPFYDLMEFPYPSGEGVIITRSTPRHAPCLHILAASSRRLRLHNTEAGDVLSLTLPYFA